MPTAPLLTFSEQSYNCPFLLPSPLQTGPGLVSLGSAVSLQNTPPGMQEALNKWQHPHPHQNTTAGVRLCTVKFCSPLPPHCQSSSRSYCNHLHMGSRQWSYPTLRKTTQLFHAAPLQVQGEHLRPPQANRPLSPWAAGPRLHCPAAHLAISRLWVASTMGIIL